MDGLMVNENFLVYGFRFYSFDSSVGCMEFVGFIFFVGVFLILFFVIVVLFGGILMVGE